MTPEEIGDFLEEEKVAIVSSFGHAVTNDDAGAAAPAVIEALAGKRVHEHE